MIGIEVPPPSASIKSLSSNSMAAMLAAIEVYNKPQMSHRDEVVVVNIVNAWEPEDVKAVETVGFRRSV